MSNARLGLFRMALIVAIVCAVVAEFLSGRYEANVDHEVYFGQRLLDGVLIWTQEYHDKLPVLQWIFLIPLWVGLRSVGDSQTPWNHMLRMTLIWLALIGFFGIMFNAAPYLLSGELPSFFAGLAVMAQETTQQSFESILRAQIHVVRFYPWFSILAIYAGMVWCVLALLVIRRRVGHMARMDFFLSESCFRGFCS